MASRRHIREVPIKPGNPHANTPYSAVHIPSQAHL